MDYPTLKALINTNPEIATATDQELADWCNEAVIDETKTSLPNEEVLAVILQNVAEFSALAEGDKQIVRDILYIGDSVPTQPGNPARDTLVSIFGGASTTIQTLAAAISYQVTRAANVGIVKKVSPDHVAYARTI